MKIKIIKRIGKTLDGVKIGEFIQDNEYKVDDAFGRKLVENGIAEPVVIPVVESEPQTESQEIETELKPAAKRK